MRTRHNVIERLQRLSEDDPRPRPSPISRLSQRARDLESQAVAVPRPDASIDSSSGLRRMIERSRRQQEERDLELAIIASQITHIDEMAAAQNRQGSDREE